MVRRVIEVLAAVLLGAAVFLLGRLLVFPDHQETPAPTTETTVETATDRLANLERADPADFIAAYERSRQGPYFLRATRTRYEDGDEITSIKIKEARAGGRAFLLEGDAVVIVEDGEQTVCDMINGRVVNCGPGQPAATAAELALLMAQPLTIDPDDDRSPKYLLYEAGDLCWMAIATRPLPLEPWGQSTTWCFDPETGALISRETVTGRTRFVVKADLVSSNVTETDFLADPP